MLWTIEHHSGRTLHLLRLGEELRSRGGAVLGRIGGQLDAIDRKHRTADQALTIKYAKYLTKDRADCLARAADKVGDGRKVRLGIAADGDKQDIVATGPLDTPGTGQAL